MWPFRVISANPSNARMLATPNIFMQRFMSRFIQLLVTIERRVHEGDAMAHGILAVLADRIQIEGFVTARHSRNQTLS